MKEEIKKSRYIPHGVCSRYIDLTISDGVITEIYIDGGCRGNLQGICSLVTCRTVKEVIEKLEGIRCGDNETSCPDQLAQALKQMY